MIDIGGVLVFFDLISHVAALVKECSGSAVVPVYFVESVFVRPPNPVRMSSLLDFQTVTVLNLNS